MELPHDSGFLLLYTESVFRAWVPPSIKMPVKYLAPVQLNKSFLNVNGDASVVNNLIVKISGFSVKFMNL